jgi:hypothetical protein
MFAIRPLSLLPKRSNHVTQGTQALVDTLRLLHPLLLNGGPARKADIEPLRPRQIDKVQTPFTFLTSAPRPAHPDVHTTNPQCEDRVGAGGTFIHERGSYAPSGLGKGK